MTDNTSPSYRAELEGIKAPLGVILYLIKRDNVDIYDIPIAKITRDYLAYIEFMEELQIELAGEFFVLAATLMRIKAQMLLRRDDETEDPREELVRNLLEYKRMVEAARSFQELEAERLKVFQRPVPQREKDYQAEAAVDLNLFELMRAFREVMAEFEAGAVSEIELEPVTIEQKLELIQTMIDEQEQVSFRDLLLGSGSRLEIIVTFMALLEMIKRGSARCRQHGAFGEIWIYAGRPAVPEEAPIPEGAAAPEESPGTPQESNRARTGPPEVQPVERATRDTDGDQRERG